MVELIKGIAIALVDNSDEITITIEAITDGPDATLIRLQVAPADVGKVIGKQGRTARSIRTILSGASMKLGHRYSLDIVEVAK